MRIHATLIVLMLVALVGCGGGGAKKLPESGYQVEFGPHGVASEMNIGGTVSADITVKNISPVVWPSKPDSKGRYAVNLSYHWLDRKGVMVIFDGLRTPLPADLKPGETVSLNAAIQAPAKPGRYTLEVTLVQERSAWFPEKSGAKLEVPVTVTEPGGMAANSVAPDRAPEDDLSRERKSQSSENVEHARTAAKRADNLPSKQAPATQGAANTNKSAPSTRGGGAWTIQLGAFPEPTTAASMAKSLKTKGYDAYVTIVKIKGREWHRVRVGHLSDRAEAEKLMATLRSGENAKNAFITSR